MSKKEEYKKFIIKDLMSKIRFESETEDRLKYTYPFYHAGFYQYLDTSGFMLGSIYNISYRKPLMYINADTGIVDMDNMFEESPFLNDCSEYITQYYGSHTEMSIELAKIIEEKVKLKISIAIMDHSMKQNKKTYFDSYMERDNRYSRQYESVGYQMSDKYQTITTDWGLI